MGQTAAVSFGAPFGRSIRVRFRIQMFRCMNWIAIKRLRTAPARALGAKLIEVKEDESIAPYCRYHMDTVMF